MSLVDGEQDERPDLTLERVKRKVLSDTLLPLFLRFGFGLDLNLCTRQSDLAPDSGRGFRSYDITPITLYPPGFCIYHPTNHR